MKFAKRMERMQSSEIRELLKLTAPVSYTH